MPDVLTTNRLTSHETEATASRAAKQQSRLGCSVSITVAHSRALRIPSAHPLMAWACARGLLAPSRRMGHPECGPVSIDLSPLPPNHRCLSVLPDLNKHSTYGLLGTLPPCNTCRVRVVPFFSREVSALTYNDEQSIESISRRTWQKTSKERVRTRPVGMTCQVL